MRIACSGSDKTGQRRKMVTVDGESPSTATYRWDTRRGQDYVIGLGVVDLSAEALRYARNRLSLIVTLCGPSYQAWGTTWTPCLVRRPPDRYRVLRHAEDPEQDETILRTHDRRVAIAAAEASADCYAWDGAEHEMIAESRRSREEQKVALLANLRGQLAAAEGHLAAGRTEVGGADQAYAVASLREQIAAAEAR